MIGAVHTSLTGWDWFAALVVVLVAWILTRVVPEVAWVPLATLLIVALTLFALLVSW